MLTEARAMPSGTLTTYVMVLSRECSSFVRKMMSVDNRGGKVRVVKPSSVRGKVK